MILERYNTMKVLLVEDDPLSRQFLKEMVERQNHEVSVAEDGRQGFEVFCTFKPDLVITDINMPHMSGLELLAKIRERNDEVIVIVTTAYGCEDYALEALRQRANNYVAKPVRYEELVPVLKKYAAIIRHRLATEVQGKVTRRELTVEFENRLSDVPRMASWLVRETAGCLSTQQRLGIHLGLAELLSNAIEYGNLEITKAEKLEALAADPHDGVFKLHRIKLENRLLADRRVVVDYSMAASACEWIIQDAGKGFDWKSLIVEPSEENLLEAHGRGIMLSRMQFDELEYLGSGNTVRIRKNRPTE